MSDLLIKIDGPVVTVTLNRPDKLNAITADMLTDFGGALATFRDTPGQRVLLVRAAGRFFSAGMDISAGMGDGSNSALAFRTWYRTALHTLFDEMEATEKPIVFAIHGKCLGGALEMALSADFRLASTQATFALPEITLGVIPGSGGTSRLTRLVGTGWAKWMVMGAQEIPARQAAEIGLIQQASAPDGFDQNVAAFCDHLASLPPEAIGLAKLSIDTVRDLGRQGGRAVERMANSMLIQTDEHAARLAAFQSGRKKS